MKRILAFLALALPVLLSGCVDRRYVIQSDPPGALVYRNGVPIGSTPVDDHFIYYGKYDFTLVKDGYETLHVQQEIPAPWYEWPGIDFISENLIPCTIRDVRRFNYKLNPVQHIRTDEILSRAEELRQRGRSIGAPPPPPPPPPPGTTPLPVPTLGAPDTGPPKLGQPNQ